MKYYLRERKVAELILDEIRKFELKKEIRIMHVCGTHEQTIARFGLRKILPKKINVICGPGCPVCVTSSFEIDFAINLALKENVILTTFGDMFRTPGSNLSLADAKSDGADVRVIYGVDEAVQLAKKYPEKEVVHFAIGFETTAPSTAAEILRAENLDNFSIIPSHRIIPPAMEYLLESGDNLIDAFICPGHVSTIIGFRSYESIARRFNRPCVVAGFEPNDVLLAILMILRQLKSGKSKAENEYIRSVSPYGNVLAKKKMKKVFKISDKNWRGIGLIKNSGLKLRKKFEKFDAEKKFDIKVKDSIDVRPGCKCGEIMKGLAKPTDCPYFKRTCTPEHPIGACIVSIEGACNVAYRYGE